MITLHKNNFGQGVNRYAMDGKKLIATIHQHDGKENIPKGAWTVNRINGRVDRFYSYAECKNDILKGL